MRNNISDIIEEQENGELGKITCFLVVFIFGAIAAVVSKTLGKMKSTLFDFFD